MNNTPEEDIIKQTYDTLFDKDENGKDPSINIFLTRLIYLESAGKRELFRTFKGKSKEEIKLLLQSKSREDREKTVSKEHLGKEMTISDVIDEYSNMIKKTFKEKPIQQALEDLGIECENVNNMILQPEGPQRLLQGGSQGGEDNEEEKILKFKQYQEKCPVLFLDILTVKNGIFPGDIKVFTGVNEKNALRYTGYICVQIERLGKTIFINDMKGETTFVCDKIVTEEEMKKSKKELSERLGDAFHSVRYPENNKKLWELDMLDLLFGPEQGSKKFIKDSFVDSYGNLTEKGKERFNLKTQQQRAAFKLSNIIGYLRLAGIYSVERENKDDLYKDDAFCDLSMAIFGEDNPEVINLKEELYKESPEWIKFEIESRREERFKLRSTKDRREFKIGNVGFIALARMFIKEEGGKKKRFVDLYKDDAFYELSKAIFGEDDPEVIKLKKILEKSSTKWIKSEIEKRREERFKLKDKERSRREFKIEIGDKDSEGLVKILGYAKIAGKFNIKRDKTDDMYKFDVFYELSEAIFGKDDPEVIKLKKILDNSSPEGIRSELNKPENKKKRFRLKKSYNERVAFSLLEGIGYMAITSAFGIKRDKPNDIYKFDVFYELSKAIFGEDDPEVINLKETMGKLLNERSPERIKSELKKPENKEKRFGLTTVRSRINFKTTEGVGYKVIASTFNIEGEKPNDIYKDNAFYKLSKAIFGENDPEVIKLKETKDKLLKKKSPERIQSELDKPENKKKRFGLKKHNERAAFGLSEGIGYMAIASVFGIKRDEPNDIYKFDVFYELSKAIFGEDDPEVLKLKETMDKLLKKRSPERIQPELKKPENKKRRFGLIKYDERARFSLSEGIGYMVIASAFGITSAFGIKRKNSKDIYKFDVFYELSKVIFGEDDPEVLKLKETMDKLLKKRSPERIQSELKKPENKKRRFGLTTANHRKKFKITEGIGYMVIASAFDITKERSNDLFQFDVFYELSKAIFGENDPEVIKLKEELDNKGK